MKETITVTRKGQATIPAAIRRKLGVGSLGGVLQMSFDEAKGQLIISRPTDVADLSAELTGYIKPSIKPLTDVDSYYQANRRAK